MSHRPRAALARRWWRPALGAIVLIVIVVLIGPEAVLAGVRGLDPWALLGGVGLAAWSTAWVAWRWVAIARAGGMSLTLRDAVWAYYRSLLLNSTLPGGVLGDVDRAAWHARDQQDMPRAAGAVVVERTAGQAALLLIAAVVLVILGPAAGFAPAILAGLVIACVIFAVVAVVVGLRTRVFTADRTSAGLAITVVVASTLAIAGYVGTFLLAARAVGVDVPLPQLLPLAVLVIAGSAIPVNFAGWGPREGVAAWAFAVAGLGADLGMATSVAYGLISLVAVLPGVVPIVLGRRRGPHSGSLAPSRQEVP